MGGSTGSLRESMQASPSDNQPESLWIEAGRAARRIGSTVLRRRWPLPPAFARLWATAQDTNGGADNGDRY
jgi:hypothetical protein